MIIFHSKKDKLRRISAKVVPNLWFGNTGPPIDPSQKWLFAPPLFVTDMISYLHLVILRPRNNLRCISGIQMDLFWMYIYDRKILFLYIISLNINMPLGHLYITIVEAQIFFLKCQHVLEYNNNK